MCYQKYIGCLCLTRLNLKKLGYVYFVPVVVMFAILPIMGFAYVTYHGNSEDAQMMIFYDIQKYIPFFSSWWILFGLADYVDGNICDIINIHKRLVIMDYFVIITWYYCHVIALFCFYWIFLENYWLDFILIVIEIFFFSSISFMLLFICRNLLSSFLFVFLYEIFAFLVNAQYFEFINVFSIQRIYSLQQLTYPYVPLVFLSVIFLLIGNVAFCKFKSLTR